MKITCDTCGSHYKIADEKVRGRRVKVKCKSCGKTLVVDGANEAAAAAPASAPGGAAAAAADTWSINLSETDQRSMTTNEIADGLRAGWISKDAYVWREGMAEWQPLTQVPELRDALGPSSTRSASVPPAAAAPALEPAAPAAFPVPGNGSVAATAPKAAARASVKRAGGDLFGRAASAGSEEEQAAASAAAPSAPLMAGTQPYDDPRPTGARNENSVLFSLDALKVGFGAPSGGAPSAAPAPAPKGRPPPRQQVASNPDDPFGMGGNDSLAGIGGAGLGFGANQALLTAPAPPEPKPFFKLAADPVVGGAAALAPLPSRRGPSKVVIFGAIVAILAVVGIVIASSGGEKKEEAEASPASTEVTAAQKAAEKPPEAKKEEPKPEEKAEEKKPESKVASATNVKRPADSTKAKSDATEKVATKTEEKPAVKQQPSDGVSTFNKGAAIAALSSSAAASSSCKRPGGPTGTGRAVVTFAPSGRVTSVNITGGEFGGSSVGSCIASVFRRASVPAFSGSPVTVSKSFSISQ
jgi:predicted Zn finger-like uncharacterized protein